MSAMPKGMEGGYGSPFVKVFWLNSQEDKVEEINLPIDTFVYDADEESDDVIKLQLTSNDPNEADNKYWQEKEELRVLWGYIGGEVSVIRKIYIQEVKWDYDVNGVTLEISATEKANSMKFQSSVEIHEGITFPGLVSKMADRHKVKAFIETYNPEYGDGTELIYDLKQKPHENLEHYLKRYHNEQHPGYYAHRYPQTKIALDYKISLPTTVNYNNYKMDVPAYNVEAPNRFSKDELARFDQKFNNIINGINTQQFPATDVIQGNKTDMGLLKSELAKQPGNYVLDTRDDEIIIRRRNFNQLPYRAYKYRGDDGLMTKFTPMSKIKSKGSRASKTGFSGWNGLDKTNYKGGISGLDDPGPKLMEYQRILARDKNLINQGKGDLTLTPHNILKHRSINIQNQRARIDNAGDFRVLNKADYSSVTVKNEADAIEAAFKHAEDELVNHMYDSSARNAVDSMNRAANARRNSALKMNPANATIVMDPNIMPGKLITILGASAKHSGNYYVTKAKHTIKNGSPAMVELDMVTTGTNKRLRKEDVPATGQVNNTIGPEKSNPTTKILKQKKEPE